MAAPTEFDTIDWHMLPVQLQEIATRCGRDVAAAVLREYGGRKLKVPVPPVDAGSSLARKIGIDLAAKLARNYPGQLLGIPKCHAHSLALRDAAIRAAYRDGRDRAALAEENNLTHRWIDRILSGEPRPARVASRRDDRQLSIFEDDAGT